MFETVLSTFSSNDLKLGEFLWNKDNFVLRIFTKPNLTLNLVHSKGVLTSSPGFLLCDEKVVLVHGGITIIYSLMQQNHNGMNRTV